MHPSVLHERPTSDLALSVWVHLNEETPFWHACSLIIKLVLKKTLKRPMD